MRLTQRSAWLCILPIAALLLLHPTAIDAQETFTISTSYQNLLSNREKTGMLDLVFIEVFERLGMDLEIVYSPAERSAVDVNAGIFDAEANRIAGMEAEYPNFRRVPEPNMTMEFVSFSTQEYDIDGWESIRERDIGVVRGWRILEENTKDFPYVATVPSEVELFRMLRMGRVELALYSKLSGYSTIQEMHLEEIIFHLEPPLAARDMYLYVHARHEALTDEIAQVLREIKQDGTYQAIVDRVLNEYGIRNE